MVINAGQCHYAAVDRRSGVISDIQDNKKENSLDIKKFECALQPPVEQHWF